MQRLLGRPRPRSSSSQASFSVPARRASRADAARMNESNTNMTTPWSVPNGPRKQNPAKSTLTAMSRAVSRPRVAWLQQVG
jgi:hypothetical protein